MQHFFDGLFFVWGFLASISSIKVVQSMWFCPNRLPVIRVAFISKEIYALRTSCRSQDFTNIFTVV